eukprot:4581183-Prymnesium_polylepis.1
MAPARARRARSSLPGLIWLTAIEHVHRCMTMTNRDSSPPRPALSRFGVCASAEFRAARASETRASTCASDTPE